MDGEGAGTGVDLTQSQLLKLGAVSDLTVAPKVTDVTHWDYYEPQVRFKRRRDPIDHLHVLTTTSAPQGPLKRVY